MRRRGFTLIEVLVALVIAALGLAAVLSVVTNTARDSNYLRDKTLASWIALNQITLVRISNTLPSVDKTSGDVDYANGKWKWLQTVTQTDVAGMRRIDVAVRHAEDPESSPVATLTGFVGRTQVQSQPSAATWELTPVPAGGTSGATLTPTTPTTPTTPPAPVRPVVPGNTPQ